MPNASVQAAAKGMPKISRRSLLAHAGVALTGGAAIAFAVPDMDARADAAGFEPIPAEPADPLLALVLHYRHQLAIFNASGDLSKEEDAALQAATWEPPYDVLCSDPPAATTLQGAVEAVRTVVDEEENCGVSEEFSVKVLRAALAYFDGRA